MELKKIKIILSCLILNDQYIINECIFNKIKRLNVKDIEKLLYIASEYNLVMPYKEKNKYLINCTKREAKIIYKEYTQDEINKEQIDIFAEELNIFLDPEIKILKKI